MEYGHDHGVRVGLWQSEAVMVLATKHSQPRKEVVYIPDRAAPARQPLESARELACVNPGLVVAPLRAGVADDAAQVSFGRLGQDIREAQAGWSRLSSSSTIASRLFADTSRPNPPLRAWRAGFSIPAMHPHRPRGKQFLERILLDRHAL